MTHAVVWLVTILVGGAYVVIVGSAILLGWQSARVPDGAYSTDDLELVG